MDRLPPMYGKEVPVWFLEGYMCSMIDAIGLGSVQGVCVHAGASWIPEPTQRYRWTQPLFDYLDSTTPHHPLDYQMVALLHEGLRYMYPSGDSVEDMFVYTMHTTGQVWWFGEAPATYNSPWDSLLTKVGPTIITRLSDWKRESRGTASISTLVRQAPRLGIQFAIEELANCSGMDCYCEDRDTELHIIIPTCPLCLHANPPCRVFIGMVEAILMWLYHSHLRTAIPPSLQIDKARSTGHHIILVPIESE